MKIKLDHSTLQLISIFTKITGVPAKDCFADNVGTQVFIIDDKMPQAIGKQGSNVKKLENVLKRKVKILLFNPNLKEFVKNIVYPLKVHRVDFDGSTLVVEPADTKTRGMLIGRNAQNLRNFENIVKRYFDIGEMKVP